MWTNFELGGRRGEVECHTIVNYRLAYKVSKSEYNAVSRRP